LGNVRFSWTIWEAFEGKSLGGCGEAVRAGVSNLVGGEAGQAGGGVEPGISAVRDEPKPGRFACQRWHAGQ
jgi:hypothetical protein